MQLWYTSFTVQGASRSLDKPAKALLEVDSTAIDSKWNVNGDRGTEVTQDVSFEAHAPIVDFTSKSVTFTVSVKNKSFSYLTDPLILVLDKIESDFGALTAANADNGLKGEGASWTLFTNRRGLAPGAQSESRVIQWHFDGRVPEPMHLLSQFVAHFKVFSKRRKTNG
jgi:hypothetical protein